MAQKVTISVRVSGDLLKAIDSKAGKEFCSRSEAASLLIAASDGGTVEPSPMADVKERGAKVDLTMKEIRLAQLRKQLLTVEGAVGVVEATFGEMKTEAHSLLNDIAREFNLDAEKLRRRFDTAMAGPTTVERETYQRLANDFSKEQLPT